MAKEFGVDILPYPPNSTHFMQVLDQAFGPITVTGQSLWYNMILDNTRTIDRYMIVGALEKGCTTSFTPAVLVAAWMKVKQWPPVHPDKVDKFLQSSDWKNYMVTISQAEIDGKAQADQLDEVKRTARILNDRLPEPTIPIPPVNNKSYIHVIHIEANT